MIVRPWKCGQILSRLGVLGAALRSFAPGSLLSGKAACRRAVSRTHCITSQFRGDPLPSLSVVGALAWMGGDPQAPILLPPPAVLADGDSDRAQMTMRFEELAAIAAVTAGLRPRTVLEFGTFNGKSTVALAMNVAADGLVYTIDLPPDAELDAGISDPHLVRLRRVGHLFAGRPEAGRIRQLLGDSRTMSLREVPRPVQLAVIDGSHTYECCRSDTDRALELMEPGGVLLWHDFGLLRLPPDYGVTQAVMDTCRTGKVECRWLAETSLVLGIVRG